MEDFFTFDKRLGISIPDLPKPFRTYSIEVQSAILSAWENQRGAIPDRVKEMEYHIERCLDLLNQEDDFEASCEINEDISRMAATINDLWIWYRADQVLQS
ncbi:hypothetical protein [Thalassobacillus pellis]|uniref:hypothetical protein n=1 Tax=Thalassobacillus pellis TaxID=748008 RepID=UPI0019612D8E|nr:hypothetical protein [Thalassobacillus pellis]MBM7554960.1 hypothetical protein [Thalassobacillus pellis]